jgi:hypothetical protein
VKRAKRFIHFLPIYGCVSTGMIYLGIGMVAILSFFKLKEGGADESSLFAFLNEYHSGKVVVWIILLGTVSYIFWRIYESFTDPYDYGRTFIGLSKRIGIALSSIADILIAHSAVIILLGASNVSPSGHPEQQQELAHDMLSQRNGDLLVVIVGCIVLITAAVQFLYGITRGYKERLDIAHFGEGVKTFIHVVAWAGYFCRGVIIGIIGFFIFKAGIMDDATLVVNTDKAFDFIGDQVGHFYFIATALGTISYAVFMFVLGVTYNSDKN